MTREAVGAVLRARGAVCRAGDLEAGGGPLAWIGLAAFAAHLGWQVSQIKGASSPLALAAVPLEPAMPGCCWQPASRSMRWAASPSRDRSYPNRQPSCLRSDPQDRAAAEFPFAQAPIRQPLAGDDHGTLAEPAGLAPHQEARAPAVQEGMTPPDPDRAQRQPADLRKGLGNRAIAGLEQERQARWRGRNRARARRHRPDPRSRP